MKKYEKTALHDGVCVAKMILIMPDADETRMGVFYRSLADESTKWFEEKLIPEAVGKYESSDDERKKWRWRPDVFCINCRCTDKDNIRTCFLDITLSDANGISKCRRVHKWDIKRDRICKRNVKKQSIANND